MLIMVINISMLWFDIADSNKPDGVPLLSCSEVSSNIFLLLSSLLSFNSIMSNKKVIRSIIRKLYLKNCAFIKIDFCFIKLINYFLFCFLNKCP